MSEATESPKLHEIGACRREGAVDFCYSCKERLRTLLRNESSILEPVKKKKSAIIDPYEGNYDHSDVEPQW